MSHRAGPGSRMKMRRLGRHRDNDAEERENYKAPIYAVHAADVPRHNAIMLAAGGHVRKIVPSGPRRRADVLGLSALAEDHPLRGNMRVEFRMKVSSELTWMKAASMGLRNPIAARTMPTASTPRVP